MPPTVHEFDVCTLETSLWSVEGDEPIWSSTTELLAPSHVLCEIEGVTGRVIGALVKRGIIRTGAFSVPVIQGTRKRCAGYRLFL